MLDCDSFVQPDVIIADWLNAWERFPEPDNLFIRLTRLTIQSDPLAEQNEVAAFDFDFATGEIIEYDLNSTEGWWPTIKSKFAL